MTTTIPAASSFFVPGNPVPQGSMRKNAYGQIIHSNKALPGWRSTVTHASTYLAADTYSVAVGVNLEFSLLRPKSVKRAWPITKRTGDIDKLIRAILDALTDATVLEDDSRVVSVWASKRYVTDPAKAGVNIAIYPIDT